MASLVLFVWGQGLPPLPRQARLSLAACPTRDLSRLSQLVASSTPSSSSGTELHCCTSSSKLCETGRPAGCSDGTYMWHQETLYVLTISDTVTESSHLSSPVLSFVNLDPECVSASH